MPISRIIRFNYLLPVILLLLSNVDVKLTANTIYLKAACDFTDKKDVAEFYYSLDGKSWQHIGTTLKMSYTLPHFMGYRFGLFNYATRHIGGFADFDFFHIDDKL